MFIFMLLTLTAFTTVVLSIAENKQAAAQGEQVYHTLPAHTCSGSLSSSPGLPKVITAQPSPSTRARVCWDSLSQREKLGRRHKEAAFPPCLECWQCLSIPALVLMARTLQPLSAPSPSLAPAASVWQHPELPKTSCPHPWDSSECFRDNQLARFCVCTGAVTKVVCSWCHRLIRRITNPPHCSSLHTAHVEPNVWHFQARVQSEFPCLSARRMMSFLTNNTPPNKYV